MHISHQHHQKIFTSLPKNIYIYCRGDSAFFFPILYDQTSMPGQRAAAQILSRFVGLLRDTTLADRMSVACLLTAHSQAQRAVQRAAQRTCSVFLNWWFNNGIGYKLYDCISFTLYPLFSVVRWVSR